LFVTGAARSLGVPVSSYTDDVMLASFSVHLLAPVWFQARFAEAAAYIMCYLPVEAGYFIGTQFQFYQATLLPDDKRLKLSSLIEQILASRDVGLRKLQKFARKVFT